MRANVLPIIQIVCIYLCVLYEVIENWEYLNATKKIITAHALTAAQPNEQNTKNTQTRKKQQPIFEHI